MHTKPELLAHSRDTQQASSLRCEKKAKEALEAFGPAHAETIHWEKKAATAAICLRAHESALHLARVAGWRV